MGLSPLTMSWTSSGDIVPSANFFGRRPRERISAALLGLASAYSSALVRLWDLSSGAGCGAGGSAVEAARAGAGLCRRGRIAGVGVRLVRLARGLQAEQLSERAARLTHHAGGLRGAFQDVRNVRRVEPGEAQAVERLGICGDALRGEDHLGSVDGVQRCDLGDDGVVAADAVFG